MKTVKLTDEELATLKTALSMQIRSIDRKIHHYKERVGYVPAGLLEIRQRYETAFEVLSFAE